MLMAYTCNFHNKSPNDKKNFSSNRLQNQATNAQSRPALATNSILRKLLFVKKSYICLEAILTNFLNEEDFFSFVSYINLIHFPLRPLKGFFS